jgi:hypothetical protein
MLISCFFGDAKVVAAASPCAASAGNVSAMRASSVLRKRFNADAVTLGGWHLVAGMDMVIICQGLAGVRRRVAV